MPKTKFNLKTTIFYKIGLSG